MWIGLVAPAPSADDLAAQAEAAFAESDYDAVTRALQEAYAIDPRASFVFGLAQADRLGGRCAAAIEGYAAYLSLSPPAKPAEDARLAMQECRTVLDARDRALARARDGDIEGARDVLTALQQEGALSDVAELALARGDVEREAGNCDEARASYRALEDLHPKADVLAVAREHARDCPVRARVPPPRVPAVDRAEPPPAAKPRPWHRDPAGGILAGLGTAGVAVGIGLVVGSVQLQRGAPDLADEGAFADRRRTAARMHVAGWSVLAVGGALLVSSAVRWGLVARASRRAGPRASAGR
jgi:tetratricopeptide (TPR) repeat protein